MNKFSFWGCVAIALSIMVLGAFFFGAVGKIRNSERVVSVKGLSEREVKADKVIWPIVYKEASNDISALSSATEHQNKKIIEFLLAGGISKDEITISPASIYDAEAERYGSTEFRFRYKSTNVITVVTNNVDLVRQLVTKLGDLLKQGITITDSEYEYKIQYSFNALNDIKPEMIEEATKNARASAEKFAADSRSTLGKIRNANQGQFSITDRDGNTPYIKTVRVVTTIQYYLKD